LVDVNEALRQNTPPPTGYLARRFGGVSLPLEVLPSAAGFYLGTRDHDGTPYSRESEEYWATCEEAEAALKAGKLGAWTQRPAP
jgi:hypothetical protein